MHKGGNRATKNAMRDEKAGENLTTVARGLNYDLRGVKPPRNSPCVYPRVRRPEPGCISGAAWGAVTRYAVDTQRTPPLLRRGTIS